MAILRIERARPNQMDGVNSILTKSELRPLPTDGATNIALAALDPNDAVIGCAAIELYGDAGLLRSVAVHPDHRRQHLGGYLVAAAQEEAVEAGLKHLYLLTETAESFFCEVGYEAIDRGIVPEAVLGSDQFAKLCPSTAVAMRRDLYPQD